MGGAEPGRRLLVAAPLPTTRAFVGVGGAPGAFLVLWKHRAKMMTTDDELEALGTPFR